MVESMKKARIARLAPRSIMLLFSTVYFVSYLTRINYAAVISVIIAEEGIQATLASVAVTGAFITYGIGQLLSGWLSDRVQPAKLVAAALLATSALNLAVPFCTPLLRNAVWSCNGMAQAFIWPPLVKMLPALLEPAYQLRVSMRISWGGNLGNIAVYLIAPLCIGSWGFRSVFFLAAIAGFAMAAVWMFLCRGFAVDLERPHATAQKTDAPKRQAPAGVFLLVMLTIVLQGSLRDGVTTWMPSYMSDTFALGSALSVLTSVCMPIFALLCIWGVERLYYAVGNVQKCTFLLFAVALIASLCIPKAASVGVVPAILLFSLIVGPMHGINSLQTCMLPRQMGDAAHLGFYTGAFNGCVYIGSALSTYVFAQVSETFGWNGTVLVWCVTAGLGALLCLLLSLRRQETA